MAEQRANGRLTAEASQEVWLKNAAILGLLVAAHRSGDCWDWA